VACRRRALEAVRKVVTGPNGLSNGLSCAVPLDALHELRLMLDALHELRLMLDTSDRSPWATAVPPAALRDRRSRLGLIGLASWHGLP
jgi:hypothetical protein